MKIDQLLSTIETYRLPIGFFLIALVFTGGLLLLWPKENAIVQSSTNTGELETKVAQLQKTVEELTNRVNELSSAASQTTSQTKTVVQTADAATKSSPSQSGIVHLNSATVSELDSLPGIGPTYAQRIIDYRTTNGGFKTIDQIKDVKGIGDKTFAQIKDKIAL